MRMKAIEKLVLSLLMALSFREAQAIAAILVKKHGCVWTPFGGSKGNYAAAVSASLKPGKVIELVSNMWDATIEYLVQKARREGRTVPHTFRQCVEHYFNFIPGGRMADVKGILTGTTKNPHPWRKVSEQHLIGISEGPHKNYPNLDLRDFGIGVSHDDAALTFDAYGYGPKRLSTNQGGRWHLGNIQAIGCSQGTLIRTRKQPSINSGPDVVSALFIRLHKAPGEVAGRDDTYYESLRAPDGTVLCLPAAMSKGYDLHASCRAHEKKIRQDKKAGLGRAAWGWDRGVVTDVFEPGTHRTQFGFDLAPFVGTVNNTGNDTETFFNMMAADAPMPFVLAEFRDRAGCTNPHLLRHKTGLLGQLSGTMQRGEDSRVVATDTLTVPYSYSNKVDREWSNVPVQVRYFLYSNPKKSKNPLAGVVTPGVNVVVTGGDFGQTVHFEGSGFFSGPKCSHLRRISSLLIVVIDCHTGLPADLCDHLINSDRSLRMKDQVVTGLLNTVRNALAKDEDLRQAALDQHEQQAEAADHGDVAEFVRRVTERGNGRGLANQAKPRQTKPAAIALRDSGTLPTTLYIESNSPLILRPGGHADLRVACNGPVGTTAAVFTGSTGCFVQVPSEVPFSQGRAAIRLSGLAGVRAGTRGKIRVQVTGHQGPMFEDIDFVFSKKNPKDDPTGGNTRKGLHDWTVDPKAVRDWSGDPKDVISSPMLLDGKLLFSINLSHPTLINGFKASLWGTAKVKSTEREYLGMIGSSVGCFYAAAVQFGVLDAETLTEHHATSLFKSFIGMKFLGTLESAEWRAMTDEMGLDDGLSVIVEQQTKAAA